MKRVIFCCMLCLLVLLGCGNRPYYAHYVPINQSAWHADSVVHFAINITDTVAHYQLILNVRHDDSYPFQNMWVFTGMTSPEQHTDLDSIEFYLADQRGRWLGNGSGGLRVMPVLLSDDIFFAHQGHYEFTVRHGMRTEVLSGIHDIGLECYVKE